MCNKCIYKIRCFRCDRNQSEAVLKQFGWNYICRLCIDEVTREIEQSTLSSVGRAEG